jgi:hypothetical protein
MLILGLDPGGLGKFGWCVAEALGNGRIRLRESGTADHATQAIERASQHVAKSEQLSAAGIDSPLFWVASGDRRVDQLVRAAMKGLGATNVHGTVQQVNSLRGACLVQGVMAARLLRVRTPQIRLTESHPKALLWLIRVASKQRRVIDVRMENLVEFIECEVTNLSEDERDAALGAVGASAMLLALDGWKDLSTDEDGTFAPVPRVEYWMPVARLPAA